MMMTHDAEVAFWESWFERHSWPVEIRRNDRSTSFHFEEPDEDGVPRARCIIIQREPPVTRTPALIRGR
jgi:hypothetical protein